MKFVAALHAGGYRSGVQPIVMKELPDPHLIGGSSGGGINAVFRSLGFSWDQIAEMHAELGPRVFERSWWQRVSNPKGMRGPKYGDDAMEGLFREFLGSRKFGEAEIRTLIICYDLRAGEQVVMKSWKPEYEELSAVDVCMGTSAAQTYFPPRIVGDWGLIDGGNSATDPSNHVYSEAAELWPDENVHIISIGTGGNPVGADPEAARGWGVLRWAHVLPGVMLDGPADATHYHVRAATRRAGDVYVRMQPRGLELDMDDASDEALDAITAAGQEMVARYSDEIAEVWTLD